MAKEVTNENITVVSAVSKTEEFLEKNKKIIWGIIAAIVVLGGACYLYYKFAYQPKQKEALEQMYKAEDNFNNGNFDLALNGDGNVLGFKQIIEEYGKLAGNGVFLYAAICEINAGNPDAALDYLSEYDSDDDLMEGRALALKGDAYCDKGDYKNAASCFSKAAAAGENNYNAGYLLKAGNAYEAAGDLDKALEAYRNIKDNYPMTMEAYEIDKYITRIEVKK